MATSEEGRIIIDMGSEAGASIGAAIGVHAQGHLDGNSSPVSSVAITPQEVYDGGYPNARGIYLRIANGGAGQSGLIKAWADAFIQDSVVRGLEPFKVAWYLGDTTESLAFLAVGYVDIAITYNEAAERQSQKSGASVDRRYAWRDHFVLVGPRSNPAGLDTQDDVLEMFNKIVTGGNTDVATPPAGRPAVRFLSRFDKSATNIKESELFIEIGQVPWGLAYSKWYHQYPRFPLEALTAASLLTEYTLTDRGTWLSSPAEVTSQLEIFKAGSDDAQDPLLNPAHALLGAKADPEHVDIARRFMDWAVSDDGGQKIIGEFKKNGEVLYSKRP